GRRDGRTDPDPVASAPVQEQRGHVATRPPEPREREHGQDTSVPGGLLPCPDAQEPTLEVRAPPAESGRVLGDDRQRAIGAAAAAPLEDLRDLVEADAPGTAPDPHPVDDGRVVENERPASSDAREQVAPADVP